jgi:hypothetical protein
MTMNTTLVERPRRSTRQILSALLAGAAILVTTTAFAKERLWCDPGCGEIVADWGLTALATIRTDNNYADPLMASRTFAMVHVAMHDAVNQAAPHYATHVTHTGQKGTADPAVAAITAARDVLKALHPAQEKMLAALYDKAMADAGIGPRVEAGKAIGAAVAAAIIADRKDDGATAKEAYAEHGAPGRYRFVPGTDFLFAPHWRNLKPFALEKVDQFRTPAPPALESAAYAKAFNEVKAAGGATGSNRTADESAYAAFWYELSEIGWNRVTRIAARQKGLDLWDSARLFALVNMALADSYVAGWDSKLAYDHWRPVTAIHRADEDRNPTTGKDASWTSFLPTPPIQDHPSTHSVLGAAAAVVLASVLRTDNVSFTMMSPSALAASPERKITSFSAAARENAESRIKAGLHFRYAIEAGLDLGRKIGGVAAEKLMPVIE